MKFRRRNVDEEKIELQMTPMIDIVFQLLVFFVMTFKIVAQEGDFNIKMPLHSPNTGTPDDSLDVPLKLKVVADANGNVAADGIRLNSLAFPDFPSLHAHLRDMLGDSAGPGSVEDELQIEIDFDYQLRYVNAIDAVTAVSGYLDEKGQVVKLIDKIQFSPPDIPQ